MDTPVGKDRAIRPYRWDALPTIPRETVGRLGEVRRAAARAIDTSKIEEALSELVGDRVALHVSLVEVTATDRPSLHGASMTLATVDDSMRVALELDRELARTLVARVIGRPAKLGDARAPLAPEIDGALLAIVARVARRAHGHGEVLRPAGTGTWRSQPGERRLDIHVTLEIGAESYPVRATVELCRAVAAPPDDAARVLSSLGELPIAVPVVVAVSSARAGDVYALAEGDVWMPGAAWTVRRANGKGSAVAGTAILAPSSADRGIAAKLGETGQIVVVGVTAVPLDVEMTMSTNQNETTATSEVVLEAPLVVRVELGAVTLAAREWAALGPGDVIALGRRVSEPVLLRIAGAEVARGELVEIEGELGVRIRERARST